MLKIKAKYFLNEAGERYFSTWFNELCKETSKQEGFIEMSYEKEESNFTVYLSFTNQEKLNLWVSTDKHDEFVATIENYFIKPEEVEVNHDHN